MPEALIEVCDLTVMRGKQVVLAHMNLSIERGAPFALIGESGSGKTTLLYALMGLAPALTGAVRIKGRTISQLSPRTRSQLMGLVFQDYQLFPHLNVYDNIELAPRCQGSAVNRAETDGMLAELKLDGLGARYPHELSGGQKQRVAIARSLILSPQVLFFDEPSSALDSKTTRELALLLLRLNEKSQVVIVSHDTVFLELACPRGATLCNGKIIYEGEMKSTP